MYMADSTSIILTLTPTPSHIQPLQSALRLWAVLLFVLFGRKV